ncbi:MAG: TIGR02710 family CRISPR-associated protein [Rhodopirellula sp.]|nr:TIGR02710 family CRISPR-associated protein [Rhodopirellula sp.]
MSHSSILLCTIGTGNIDQLRETLIEPLKKSIHKGEWTQVILLPSQLTTEHATLLQREVQDVPIDIRALPLAGAEDDVDICFGHFDQVIEEQLASGVSPTRLLADFTRGTKAMSAALVLAAVRHDLPQLRYISGGKRDQRGMVVAGTEIVSEVKTTIATARKRLDDAHQLFRRGNFAAVLDLLPDPASPFAGVWPDELNSVASFVRPLARYNAAWDRLDYRGAATIELPVVPAPSKWKAFEPTPEVRQWVSQLAIPLPDDARAREEPLRWLAIDLLANGERRLRDQQFEDALIRAYRVLELVGQLRLGKQGIHSDDLPEDDPVVKKFQEELAKKKQNPIDRLPNQKLAASREQVARLLKRFGDPLAQKLLDLANVGQIKVTRRNYSALIHGFESVSGSDPEPLRELYKRLDTLLRDDDETHAPQWLAVARRLDYGATAQD